MDSKTIEITYTYLNSKSDTINGVADHEQRERRSRTLNGVGYNLAERAKDQHFSKAELVGNIDIDQRASDRSLSSVRKKTLRSKRKRNSRRKQV